MHEQVSRQSTDNVKGDVNKYSLSEPGVYCPETDPMTPIWFKNDTWLKKRNDDGSTSKVRLNPKS